MFHKNTLTIFFEINGKNMFTKVQELFVRNNLEHPYSVVIMLVTSNNETSPFVSSFKDSVLTHQCHFNDY